MGTACIGIKQAVVSGKGGVHNRWQTWKWITNWREDRVTFCRFPRDHRRIPGVGAIGCGRGRGCRRCGLEGSTPHGTLLSRTLVSRCPIHRVSSDMAAGPRPISARWDGECPSRGPLFPGTPWSKGDLAVAKLIVLSDRVSPFLLFCEASLRAGTIYLRAHVGACTVHKRYQRHRSLKRFMPFEDSVLRSYREMRNHYLVFNFDISHLF